MEQEITRLKRSISIKLYFEGPSDWTTREFIDVIDDYFMERLAVMLNNALQTLGMEASIIEDKTECEILGEKPGCKHTLIVALYSVGSDKPIYYAVYHYRKGDNTYEFYLKDIVKA